MTYNLELRRDTPLAMKLQARIVREGPIPVAAYMEACLNDPEHGYYRVKQAIGRQGDFVTAPEISQVFGELLGLWAAVVWQQMGAPTGFNLVELGPGRGTMMADALRAGRRVPGFLEAARVTLIEPSPVLAEIQRRSLRDAPGVDLRWGTKLAELEPAPTVLLANEVLDVVPVAQYVRTEEDWVSRAVGVDATRRLSFTIDRTTPLPVLPAVAEAARPDDTLEMRDLAPFAAEISTLAQGGAFAGIFIDYGHSRTALGDTLQAVRSQRYEHPLTSPGEADLTAQVDFSSVAADMERAGLSVARLTTQAEFLGSLGAIQRASRLMAANPSRSAEIEAGIARLMAPEGMGTRFKVLGVRSLEAPPLPGL